MLRLVLTALQTLLSFIITNVLAILLSAYVILDPDKSGTSKITSVFRKLLSGWSDQQIVTGIAIQCVGLSQMATMIPYHFFIIWQLSLLSTATNLATLLAFCEELRKDYVLRWLRQVLMCINMVLSMLVGALVLSSVVKDMQPRLPIGCVLSSGARGSKNNVSLSAVGTALVMAVDIAVLILATWFLHHRCPQHWQTKWRIAGIAVLGGMGLAVIVRIVMGTQAFGHPPKDLNLKGGNEGEWSYGQVLGVVMLIMPAISAFEIAERERAVHDEPDHDDPGFRRRSFNAAPHRLKRPRAKHSDRDPSSAHRRAHRKRRKPRPFDPYVPEARGAV